MLRRNGELTDSQIRRKWPYHVALPVEDGSDFVVFCFASGKTRKHSPSASVANCSTRHN